MNPRFWPALVILVAPACFFSPTGIEVTALGESSVGPETSEADTSEVSTTGGPEPTTGGSEPTTGGGGEACGNAQIDPGEGCDSGAVNNGMNGNICKADCQLNTCGDGYAASNEGCDDGNVAEGDGCSAECKLEGCGDGVLSPPEECDDNNTIDGDGCSALCKLPFCGDGTKDPGEQCDSGQDNLDTSACTLQCKNAVCGDGLLFGGVEACDDGNVNAGDGCSSDCMGESCGDTKVQPGEECDDGMNGDPDDTCTDLCKLPVCGDGLLQPSKGETCDNAGDNGNNKPCTEACKKAVCGDGLLLDGVEQCDDANKIDTDDCRKDCSLAICGDGVINAGKETCDDANIDPGDGCAADCTKECGNGVIDPGEQCDDANANLADTCDNSCKRLRFHVFVTSAKYPADFGGLQGADKACNLLAAAAKLPGTGNFKAWLSTQLFGENPMGRLTQSTKPYILTTNVVVAINAADLADSDLNSAINITETKLAAAPANPSTCIQDLAGDTFVWTNTLGTGLAAGSACSNWSVANPDQQGIIGMLNRKDKLWTNACTLGCDKKARFYCVEQPPP